MKKACWLVLIAGCFLAIESPGQTIIISGKTINRKLTWSDFKATPDANSNFWAYTGYLVRYRYDDVRISGESVRIGSFDVTVELDPARTWARMDKVNDALLAHEQGHFDIGILCGKEILATFKTTNFERSNYRGQMQSIFQDVLKKYIDMGRQYDKETEHYRNKEEQERWNKLLAERLSK
jgi:hypothetical protein